MFRNIVTAMLLYGITLLSCSCYAIRSYPPQTAKPEWEIAEVVLADSAIVRFDDYGTIQNQMVVGGVRNEFDEVRTRKIPLAVIHAVHVRQMHWDTTSLIAGGIGAGLATFLVIAVLNQHRSKTTPGSGGIAKR